MGTDFNFEPHFWSTDGMTAPACGLSSYDDLDGLEALIEVGASGFLSKRSVSNQLPENSSVLRKGMVYRKTPVKESADKITRWRPRTMTTVQMFSQGRTNEFRAK